MDLKHLKEKLDDAVSTENPGDTDYYGMQVDEKETEEARERIDETIERDRASAARNRG